MTERRWVLQGSHLWPSEREPLPSEIVSVPMPRGSCLLWTGSTLHGAGSSAADAAIRHGLLFAFCLSWLRPEMNMHFSCPAEVAAGMDERMSTLLGFAGSHRYGPHPYISGPVFATEYTVCPQRSASALLSRLEDQAVKDVGPQGYPGDATDYGAGGLYDEEGGVVADEAPRGFAQQSEEGERPKL